MSTGSKTNETVFVAMSGGVDSSVTAHLLKEAGYNVVGVFMRCFNLDGCAQQDSRDARRVAEHLDIPFYVFDFEEEYKKKVVEYMIEGYSRGITPNPDVMCNKEIKFGLFLDKSLEMGADKVATGHYVKLKEQKPNNSRKELNPGSVPRSKKPQKTNEKTYKLFEAEDKHKDQSYFLWTLSQKELKHCLFPLGSYQKSEVREIAEDINLPVANKPDSQGICFLGQIDLSEFLSQYISKEPGPIVDTEGNHLGTHEGVWFYTLGQRRLGVEYNPPSKGSDPKPHYVAEKKLDSNTLVMAEGRDNPALYQKEIPLGDVHFISMAEERIKNTDIKARIRYNQPLQDAFLKKENKNYKVIFEKPQKFVSAGQSAVFYNEHGENNLEMLGGGVIQ